MVFTTERETPEAPPLRRARKKLLLMFSGAALALLCCGATTVYLTFFVLDRETPQVNVAGCGVGDAITVSGTLPQAGSLDQEQMENAAIIVQVGQTERVSPRGWVVAIATAMQESTLHNYGHLGDRNDHDSQGLFQQRPSQGWGTVEQITDPVHASTSFYRSLTKIDGWETMDLTVAAQAVQRSAYPDAYAKWEPLATEVVNLLTQGGARTGSGSDVGECAGPGEIAASGWTAPVPQGIVSAYRSPERPDHYGVDLGSPRGTEVRAAAGGIVITAECNAYAPDGSPYPCDVDGSPSIIGCGWYVNIQHADGMQTRYCHFASAPVVKVGQRVAAGEVIGVSGTSGNSSGPHLHFEVHVDNDQSNQGAIDPVAWLAQQGINLDV